MKSLLALLLLVPLLAKAEEPSRPNIIVFLADDMGWGDSGCYGSEKILTPNIDKLATEGVRLTQCYASCAVCSPSRSSILTGRTPYRNGVWRHLSGNDGAHLRRSEITYPSLLKKAGYQTCHVGKWHLLSKDQFNTKEWPQPDDHGYDFWMATHNNAEPSHKNPVNFVRNREPVGEIEGYSAPIVAAEAIRWLKEERKSGAPFVLSIWVHEPHKPIATDPKFEDQYDGDTNSLYMGNITQLDSALGDVMTALDDMDLTDNTMLIFTSDNGPEGKGGARGGSTGGLSGRKRADLEGGIRVPGVVRWPGKIKPGTVSEVPVIGSDLFTTILAATGTEIPTDRVIDGVNIIPAFSGEPVERKIPLFWRTHVSPASNRVAMRIGDWKIVGNDVMTEFELYQINKDPRETTDLAAQNPEKFTEMKTKIIEVWKEIEADGPSDWWENGQGGRPKKGAKLSY